jgi:hypothetical protein
MPREKLRNFGKFLKVYFTLLLFAILTAAGMSSCKHYGLTHPSDNYDVADSAMTAQLIKAAVDPSFTSVADVIMFQQRACDMVTIDKEFNALPQNILKNVAKVVISKEGRATKKSILEEYRSSKKTYDVLSEDSTKTANVNNAGQTVDLQATDLGNRRNDKAISTSYSYYNDTVDGKIRKVQVKTEKSYVE